MAPDSLCVLACIGLCSYRLVLFGLLHFYVMKDCNVDNNSYICIIFEQVAWVVLCSLLLLFL